MSSLPDIDGDALKQAVEELAEYARRRPQESARDLVTATLRTVSAWLGQRARDIANEAAHPDVPTTVDIDDLIGQLGLDEQVAEVAARPPIVVDGRYGEPILRIEWAQEEGDFSVGIGAWAGWQISDDQSGTALGLLIDRGEGVDIVDALDEASLEPIREASIAAERAAAQAAAARGPG